MQAFLFMLSLTCCLVLGIIALILMIVVLLLIFEFFKVLTKLLKGETLAEIIAQEFIYEDIEDEKQKN